MYRWTAPIAGSFAVTTDFAGIDYAYPTTTDVAVEINGVLVYSQSINSYSAGTACASNSYVPAAAFQGSYSLSAGDHVDVSVGWGSNGNYYGDATLVSIVIAGSNGASATPVGHGCGAGATVPVLACSPPVIGQSVTLSIANGTPSVGGTIFASPPPAGTIDLGGGCTAYLDVGGYFPLLDPIITNPSGAWLLSLAVPYDIGLVGFTLALQGALFGTSGPLGLDLTNGVIITVGS